MIATEMKRGLSPLKANAVPAAPPRSIYCERAAIIIMALDDDRSERLLSQMSEDEIRRLGAAMAKLGRTDIDTVEEVIEEFIAQIGHSCSLIGGYEAAEKLLSRFLPPEKVAEIMDEAKGPNGRNIWDKLSHIQPQTLSGYLRNEYPQTAAVILSRLPAQHAAKVLRLLPTKAANDISLRMVRLTSVQRPVLMDIEDALKREFTSVLGRAYERDSTSIVAEMLNRSEQDVVDRILSAIEEKEPQAAARIRRIMFTFEDLRRIEPGTFGLLIAEVPPERLPIALAGASEEILALFTSQMSERAQKMLTEELENQSAPRRKSIEEAQSEIIGTAKKMIEEGRLVLQEQDDEEQSDSDF
ncbi:MAG: flagellar motor switch protein FliG [Alphaproteobacteria bacterium]|nr:flagellar motor switch protein FliG [Alphaproteobacteria bacterium]